LQIAPNLFHDQNLQALNSRFLEDENDSAGHPHEPNADSKLADGNFAGSRIQNGGRNCREEETQIMVVEREQGNTCTHVIEESCGDVQVTKFRPRKV
jgi:hypothetical protein